MPNITWKTGGRTEDKTAQPQRRRRSSIMTRHIDSVATARIILRVRDIGGADATTYMHRRCMLPRACR